MGVPEVLLISGLFGNWIYYVVRTKKIDSIGDKRQKYINDYFDELKEETNKGDEYRELFLSKRDLDKELDELYSW